MSLTLFFMLLGAKVMFFFFFFFFCGQFANIIQKGKVKDITDVLGDTLPFHSCAIGRYFSQFLYVSFLFITCHHSSDGIATRPWAG
jgi:hypothetical protein